MLGAGTHESCCPLAALLSSCCLVLSSITQSMYPALQILWNMLTHLKHLHAFTYRVPITSYCVQSPFCAPLFGMDSFIFPQLFEVNTMIRSRN